MLVEFAIGTKHMAVKPNTNKILAVINFLMRSTVFLKATLTARGTPLRNWNSGTEWLGGHEITNSNMIG
jgi:hypothetical protein